MNIFSKIVHSIINFKAYLSFTLDSMNKPFNYLLVITIIFASIGMIKPIIEIETGKGQVKEDFIKDVANFSLKNGELKYDGQMPLIKTTTANFIFIIDEAHPKTTIFK